MNSKIDGSVRYNQVFLWRVCAVAAMGGLLFGYDLIVIGGAKPFYEAYFGIYAKPWLQGWVMSSAVVGCLLGVLLAGTLADMFGRKKLLLLAAVMFTITAVGMALAQSLTMFCIFRIIGGMGIGVASALSPMFIAEVAPKQYRGRFVSFNQLTIVIGILAAQIINLTIADFVSHHYTPKEVTASLKKIEADSRMTIDEAKARGAGETELFQIQEEASTRRASLLLASWNGQWGWRCMFGAGIVPAAAFLLLLFFVPESPRWLVQKGKSSLARLTLVKVGGDDYAAAEIRDIEQTISADAQGQGRFSELLDRRMLPVLSLGIFLAVFQQWCGINVIFYYAEEVFRSAGYEVSGLMFNIVITGIINLVFTFVAIGTVDRLGRRPLMLIGAGGLALVYAILGYCYLMGMTGTIMLVLVLCVLACFAMTLGPMVWVVLAEIFPNRVRGAAMSVAVASLWIANMILAQTFPILNRALGTYGTFWIYGGICAVSFVVIVLKLPETKGKSLEEIETIFFKK